MVQQKFVHYYCHHSAESPTRCMLGGHRCSILRRMTDPKPTLALSEHLGQHPDACHLWQSVDVFELDGRFAYRARAADPESDGPTEIDAASGFDFATVDDARVAGETRLHSEIMGD